ncbi:hypothetical protein DCO58_08165 [Helicobacter saguini]|uniref:Uncharacterized protein n=1 Tax=Helicobacter saguini TaxID=1548018 RepID=A0A347VNN2_9HELI|nr:hypothetical protein [Helicobacter saguini]MWV61701.1 hypothetical protein [Helicobacter saguini]MWV67627.1 hypothetical protein [Helicobacter saguini]MWV69978.1 hypothetical protein [Helicobacter saguini]MWV72808.1 hypothetical protein [Helicobacter saguini]TLD91996.1 hypothetical protein LS64_011095 [Helicobacter saguini]
MQKLKRFYRIYTIIIALLSLFSMVITGPNGMSLGETIFTFVFYMILPIVFYGTFIFFPNKILKKKDNTQLNQEKTFKILYFIALMIFIFGLFVINR